MSMQALKNTNFNEVDIITFNYGTNDWTSGVTEEEYKAAMENGVSTILQAYPHIRFVEISPTWRCGISNGAITR